MQIMRNVKSKFASLLFARREQVGEDFLVQEQKIAPLPLQKFSLKSFSPINTLERRKALLRTKHLTMSKVKISSRIKSSLHVNILFMNTETVNIIKEKKIILFRIF